MKADKTSQQAELIEEAFEEEEEKIEQSILSKQGDHARKLTRSMFDSTHKKPQFNREYVYNRIYDFMIVPLQLTKSEYDELCENVWKVAFKRKQHENYLALVALRDSMQDYPDIADAIDNQIKQLIVA